MIPGRDWTTFTEPSSISSPGSRSRRTSRAGRNSSDRSPTRPPSSNRSRRNWPRPPTRRRPGRRSRGRRTPDGLPRGRTIHGHRGPPSPARSATNRRTPRAIPLGDLARASGFHVRPVTLADDWWRRRGGEPLLGQLDGDERRRPWRSCRSGRGSAASGPAYELHDSDGRSRPVDLELAGLDRSERLDLLPDAAGRHDSSRSTWSASA